MEGTITILGARGFLGRELVALFRAGGSRLLEITRNTWPEPGTHLGDAVFAIGMTGNFRHHLVETHDAHLVQLHRALTNYSFDSLTYISSTRIYGRSSDTCEDAPLQIRPDDADHVYNISKIAGESLCLHSGVPRIHIARLSNLIGIGAPPHSFLASVLAEAADTGAVLFGQSPRSTKDYITVQAAARAVHAIARRGTQRVYNIASGLNVSHQEIADLLESAGYRCRFAPECVSALAAPIKISRFQDEFGQIEPDPLAAIRAMVPLAGNRGGRS